MTETVQIKIWHWLGAAVLAAVLSVTPKGCTPLPAKTMPSHSVRPPEKPFTQAEREAAEADRLWHEFYGSMPESEIIKAVVYEPVGK